ncbi:MAG: HAD hydrolase-like protein [Micromonosporaceae bacterium]|nr:HAD hydrolase-like protein [Micromonosporaceae bacterium]
MSAKPHLVWDWNGTLLDDLSLVVDATNAAFAECGGPRIDADHHRRRFRRPIADYYAEVLGRPVGAAEFAQLNRVFHDAYQAGLPCALTADADAALRAWPGSQSLLSMWFHDELMLAVAGHRLTEHFARIDGMRRPLDGAVDHKSPYLADHLAAMRLPGAEVVLIGDTVDDARAAASTGTGCVLYAGGFTDPGQLRATGYPVADSLVDAVALVLAGVTTPKAKLPRMGA